ncbi:hypothetical protein ACFO1B_09030 [Dactylosporangium siamense]|uniref:Uncharacterized protein n=1 Tax=Dactylosporangium siamense TaxID=685454 RepID=A0A919Q3K5_9ACTN|nr:hypothetical protein [Dactylosporangium siamense]GIG53240.1 hypothetical protein Dsi01nite_112810 [Dactylosporangium siamense]
MADLLVWLVAGPPSLGAPATIQSACSLVGHDLMTMAELDAALPDATWQAAPRSTDEPVPDTFWTVGLGSGPERRFSFGLNTELSAVQSAVSVANAVQDHLAGYEGMQWPECPGHQHPMAARIVDGSAVWVCRSEGRRIAEIGQLHTIA